MEEVGSGELRVQELPYTRSKRSPVLSLQSVTQRTSLYNLERERAVFIVC
jgi:hypothetical protein